MTDAELAAIAAAEQAATPGPWRVQWTTYGYRILWPPNEHGSIGSLFDEHDANFFAGCREWVPQLLAEVERLKAELAEHHRLRGEELHEEQESK